MCRRAVSIDVNIRFHRKCISGVDNCVRSRRVCLQSEHRQCSTIRVYVKTHTQRFESNISVKETPAMWCSYFSACYLSNSLPPSTSTSIARTLPLTSLLMAKILASSYFQRIKPFLLTIDTIKISPSYKYTAFSKMEIR